MSEKKTVHSLFGLNGVAPAVKPALLASGAMDGGAQPASNERRPGGP